MKGRIAECINILGEFCGVRDVPALTQDELYQNCGIRQADVMVLFGGSILCGGDVLAGAMRKNAARKYVIVGGEGHTTQTLRQKMHAEFPEIDTAGKPEAEVFAAYLKRRYGLVPDLLECDSTNCGNNITNLLTLLEKNRIRFHSIILTQDATMQRRMEAGLRKYIGGETDIINFASYRAKAVIRNGELAYQEPIWGMWDIGRYITLLMGEIQRLTDNAEGYGLKGKNYIAHVDVPDAVCEAFQELQREYSDGVREANPLYG